MALQGRERLRGFGDFFEVFILIIRRIASHRLLEPRSLKLIDLSGVIGQIILIIAQ